MQGLLLLKNNFFIKFFIGLGVPESPLQVLGFRTFRRPSGDVPGTSCAGWVFPITIFSIKMLPKFGKIERIYQVLGFIYFELTKFNTEGFSKPFQSYEIYENINNSTTIVSYDNLLDYNVYHSKIVANHGSFI